MPSYTQLTFEGTVSAQATASENTITISPILREIEIVRLQCAFISGSAATYQPVIGNVASFTTGTVDAKLTGPVTAVATMIDANNLLGFCRTDSSGKIYLRFAPNAGADNMFKYSLTVRVY